MAFIAATKAQINYMESLFLELGFTRSQRTGFISYRVHRDVQYLDEVSKYEASKIISELKEMKDEDEAKSSRQTSPDQS